MKNELKRNFKLFFIVSEHVVVVFKLGGKRGEPVLVLTKEVLNQFLGRHEGFLLSNDVLEVPVRLESLARVVHRSLGLLRGRHLLELRALDEQLLVPDNQVKKLVNLATLAWWVHLLQVEDHLIVDVLRLHSALNPKLAQKFLNHCLYLAQLVLQNLLIGLLKLLRVLNHGRRRDVKGAFAVEHIHLICTHLPLDLLV